MPVPSSEEALVPPRTTARPARTTAGSRAVVTAAAVAGLLFTGCSGTSSGTTTASSGGGTASSAASRTTNSSTNGSTSSRTATTPAVREIRVAVTGRKVSPPTADVEVRRGEPVRFVVASDVANEIHLHGVEVEREVGAGRTVTIDATYPDPGVYEVETHEPSLLLVRVVVR